MKTIIRSAVASCLILVSQSSLASDNNVTLHLGAESEHEPSSVIMVAQTVVPEAEKEAARQQLIADGPDKTSGIAAVHKLGLVPLANEFEAIHGRALRIREIIFEPGGVVAVHKHEGRPGAAYIIEGEITEHRVDVDGQTTTTVRQAGSVALESTGVVHWWRNESGKTVRALVVDIVPSE